MTIHREDCFGKTECFGCYQAYALEQFIILKKALLDIAACHGTRNNPRHEAAWMANRAFQAIAETNFDDPKKTT